MIDWANRFAGALLGAAVGDAVGLPREGMSPRRARRIFGDAPLEHRFVFRHGMMSDDTEHACMTAQALLASRGQAEAFGRSLAWRLRGWLLGVPAGVGLATLRSIVKLWLGMGPERSGVKSAGNGPAMRAPLLGVWMAATGMRPESLEVLIRASTRITHTDERAAEGAMVIALATAYSAMGESTTGGDAVARLQPYVHGAELRQSLVHMQGCLNRSATAREFAEMLGLRHGVSGYINHTVPIALYCHFRWPSDFRRGVEEAILLGGDTDTTGAIVGGIAGAALGVSAIPDSWLAGMFEWPRSTQWMKALGYRLAEQARKPGCDLGALRLFWPGLLFRNPLFAGIVLSHGFQRLFPPY